MLLFAVNHPTTKAKVFLIYGVIGFSNLETGKEEEQWNVLHAIQTEKERTSAMYGSMFGWDCPGAELARKMVSKVN